MAVIDRAWLRRRARAAAPVLFAVAVLLLILLSAWWFLLIQRTINEQHEARRDLLQLEARLHAEEVRDDIPSLVPGPFPTDPRYEILRAEQWAKSKSVTLESGRAWMPAPLGPRLALVPTPATLHALDDKLNRQRVMVLGEGSLLVSLLLIVLAMLAALVRAERRFQDEMQVFLGSMTHEMKTPLAGIKAVLQTLAMGRMPADQLGDLASMALNEVKREEHLIQNLLVAQRMRQPGASLVPERLDLATMLRQFVGHRVDLPGSEGVDWQVESPQELHVLCDPGAARTIVENLADNAVKYGANHIRLQLSAQGSRAQLAVVDDGMGFVPDRAESLFRAFGRGNSEKAVAKAGSGLGLHISRTLAERMDGSLTAHSAGEGQGATFTLDLPIATQGGATK